MGDPSMALASAPACDGAAAMVPAMKVKRRA